MSTRKAEATWKGNLKSGKGALKLGSGLYEGNYSFASRFQNGTGTNPEELIGAAHSGCYAMALSNELAEAGFSPRSVDVRADVTLEVSDGGPVITAIKLSCEAEVPDIDEAEFRKFAEGAKEGCPVSKALAGTDIFLDASLI